MPHLDLPPVELTAKHAKAVTRLVVRPARRLMSDHVNEVRLSSRRVADGYATPEGDLYFTTARSNEARPPGVAGIVRTHGDGRTSWAYNAELEAAATSGFFELRARALREWPSYFSFRVEGDGPDGTPRAGLRPPQVGALFAIGGHWSLEREPATIVMPTGTGKTEVILSALVRFARGTMLVVVPSRALLEQTVTKLLTLGMLPGIGVVGQGAPRPVVGVVTGQATSEEDFSFAEHCNVVVAVVNSLTHSDARQHLRGLARHCDYLVLDEAHHVPSETWQSLREAFAGKLVLQFTATPFRRDGRIVDGKQIFNYPLGRAQEDGYFKRIEFIGLSETSPRTADEAVAREAVKRLDADRGAGLDHLLMARCRTKERAAELLPIYQGVAAGHRPAVLHSDLPTAAQDSIISELRAGDRRIAICVNMLGEGFDLPQLKVAALHDLHLSLPILLQFTGRFTRTASPGAVIGDATMVANVADPSVSEELDQLYRQDSDWNRVLSETVSQTMRNRLALLQFFDDAEPLHDEFANPSNVRLDPRGFRPAHSATVYRASAFTPERFVDAAKGLTVLGAWVNRSNNVLFYVTATDSDVKWTRARGVQDRAWDLVVAHYSTTRDLLFIHAAASSPSIELAAAITGGTASRLQHEPVFRVFGQLQRLRLLNVGITKRGRRDLRYSSFSGADVGTALDQVREAFATKTVLRGIGFEGGEATSVGASAKGKVWSASRGTVPEFLGWCEHVGSKLTDETIDTAAILRSVLVPVEVTVFPVAPWLAFLWPDELTRRAEDNVAIGGVPLHLVDLRLDNLTSTSIGWSVVAEGTPWSFTMSFDPANGHRVRQTGGRPVSIEAASTGTSLADFFELHPPVLIYLDGNELEGSFLSKSMEPWTPEPLPAGQMSAWSWTAVDIRTESIWRGPNRRARTVQGHAATWYRNAGFHLVFDDDDPGEAADLVCMKEEANAIKVELVHCKFSGGSAAGGRSSDLDVVCQQAVRSGRWAAHARFARLCKHLRIREDAAKEQHANSGQGRPTRFLDGGLAVIRQMEQAARVKHVEVSIVVVQPGVSVAALTVPQRTVLAAANAFLLQTANVPLRLVGS